jgi:hypothetical protein
MHSRQGGGGNFDNDGNGNNNGRREGLFLTRTRTKTQTAMQPWTTTTSFIDTTTTLWSDAFLEVRGGDFNYDDNGNNSAYQQTIYSKV